MAGDRALTGDDGIAMLSKPKVWSAGAFIIGITGDSAYYSLVKHHLTWPTLLEDVEKHLEASLPSALRAAMKAENLEAADGGALIAIGGRLFGLDGVACEEILEDYAAVGSGGHVAIGALAVAKGSPRRRLEQALAAAAKHIVGVEPPFDFVNT